MRYLNEASRSAEEPDNMSLDQYRSFPAVLESARNRPSVSQFLPALSGQQFAGLSRMLDICLILASFVLAEKIYNWYFYDIHQVAAEYSLVALLCASTHYFITIVSRRTERGLAPSQISDVAKNLAISFATLLLLGFASKISDVYSRAWFMLAFVIAFFLLCTKCKIINAILRSSRFRFPIVEKIALYGSGALAIKKALEAESDGLCEVHLYDADAPQQEDVSTEFNKLLIDGLNNKFSRIILCLSPENMGQVNTLFTALNCFPVRIDVCASSPMTERLMKDFQILPTKLLVNIDDGARNEWGMLAKRGIDFLLSSLLIIILAPILAAVAIAIKWEDGGPVFFRQRRHGWNHSVISVWKFRTMNVLEDGDVVKQAKKNDPRITRIGKYLRQSSVDELPQLFNVWTGEMSLVGPRPHAVAHNLHYSDLISSYAVRHKVKPGITGWAQVKGLRGNSEDITAMIDRAEADRWYIRNWSLLLDVKILLMTPLALLTHKNAY